MPHAPPKPKPIEEILKDARVYYDFWGKTQGHVDCMGERFYGRDGKLLEYLLRELRPHSKHLGFDISKLNASFCNQLLAINFAILTQDGRVFLTGLFFEAAENIGESVDYFAENCYEWDEYKFGTFPPP